MVLTAWVERCRAWAEGWEGGEEVETVKFGGATALSPAGIQGNPRLLSAHLPV